MSFLPVVYIHNWLLKEFLAVLLKPYSFVPCNIPNFFFLQICKSKQKIIKTYHLGLGIGYVSPLLTLINLWKSLTHPPVFVFCKIQKNLHPFMVMCYTLSGAKWHHLHGQPRGWILPMQADAAPTTLAALDPEEIQVSFIIVLPSIQWF